MGYGNASSHASIQPLDRLRAHAIFSSLREKRCRVNLGIQVNLGFTYYPSIFFSFSSFVSSSSFLKKKTIVNLIEEFVVISN